MSIRPAHPAGIVELLAPLGHGALVQRVALGGGLLARHGRLSSPLRGAVALLVLPQAVQALNLARRGGPLPLISQPLAAIGYLLAHVGITVSAIRDSVALVSPSLALEQVQRLRAEL